MQTLDLEDTSEGLRIHVKVQPNARRTACAGTHAGRLKITLQAPPVDGKANDALIRFLAQFAHVQKSGVRILRGEKTREKTLLIREVTSEHFLALLRTAGVSLETQPGHDS